MDNYPSQMMIVNIPVNGDSKVDYSTNGHWKGFLTLTWISETDSISKLVKSLMQNPHSMHHVGDPRLISDGCSLSPSFPP